VYADRSQWLGDPDFFKVPVTGLISKSYAGRLRTSIDESHATPSAEVRAGAPRDFEPTETTHYSVVDADGSAVSTTTTLNGEFGNAETVTGAGFLLNNEMDDFSARPNSPNMFGLLGGEANAVAPGKRMLSSMTPTIVTRDGRTVLVLGSPGGSQIITTVLQVLLDVVDFKMNVQEAVDAPRFHHQWTPDVVTIEKDRFTPDVLNALGARGHATKVVTPIGEVYAIAVDPASGERTGASDPRADGVTLGY
jgi:gamma-glutamyltranspeptidase/glutathione hydrolase